MSLSSSRVTIPPNSRPSSGHRLVGLCPAKELWQRYTICGAVLGFTLSLLPLLAAAEHPVDGWTWQSWALSAIFSSVLAGLLLGSVGPGIFAALSFSERARRLAGRIAATVSSLVVCVYLSLRGASEAFHLSSGAPFDLGTMEFLSGSFSHLLWPLAVEYTGISLGLLLGCLGITYLCFHILRRPPVARPPTTVLGVRALSSFFGLLLLLQTLTTPGFAKGARLADTSDLSFLASIASRESEEQELAAQDPYTLRVADGPPRAAEEIWRASVAHAKEAKPNVLLIMMESVGIDHLGYEGYGRNVTPNLDRIAERSVRFHRARSTAAHSNYAQMAILSSLFPRRYSGLDTYQRLDYPRVLWHDLLSQLGYQTATHSSQDESWQGMLRFQQTGTPTDFKHSGTYEGTHLRMGAERTVPDEVTASRAVSWIERQSGAWGLYVNFQSTHFPYMIPKEATPQFQPTKPTRGKYHYLHYPKSDKQTVINRYDNALSYVDAQIGQIYDYLEASGRLKNTVLVITSDHGELFWDHGLVTHGRSLFEKEVRVPLLVHYPEAYGAADEARDVSTLDILPTLATVVGVQPHPSFQGRSLFPSEGDAPEGLTPVFMNIQGMKSADAVVCGRYKLIFTHSALARRLYDVVSDPGETRDLARQEPEITAQLSGLLKSQMRAQVDYHAPRDNGHRERFYAPRMNECPEFDSANVDHPESIEPSPAAARTAQAARPATALASH